MAAEQSSGLLALVATYGYLALFLVLFLEELGIPLPLPGDLTLLFAGYLVGMGMLRFELAVLVVVLAAVSGASGLYLLTRLHGRGWLARYGRYLHLNERRLAWFEARFQRFGPWGVLAARVMPGTRIYTSILAGLGGVSYPRFLAALGPASLLWAVLFIFAGSRVGEQWETVARLLEHHATRAGIAALLLVAVVLIVWRWRSRKSRHTNFQDALR